MWARSSFGRRLRALRLAAGLSQVELARRVGRHQTAIGPYERDEYEPPREVVEKLAQILETSPEYLYFGRSPRHSTLPVLGRIGSAGLLDAGDEAAYGLITLREEQLQGYRVEDDSMAPVFRPGQIVLALLAGTNAPGLHLGHDVLVSLADGRALLRRLMPSADPTRFDLAAYNAPTLPNVVVASTRLIVAVLWPPAWNEPATALDPKSNTIKVDEKL